MDKTSPESQHHDNTYVEAINAMNDAMNEAKTLRIPFYNAASLATVDANSRPSIRTITVCNINNDGLLLFLNKNSGKASHLSSNAYVGLCFYWEDLKLQLTVEGIAYETNNNEATLWWNKQDRDFQLSSWISEKQAPRSNITNIEERRQSTREQFMDERIPMPEYWAAYRIKPSRIELWKASWKNYRGRISYNEENGIWIKHTHSF